MKSKKAPKQSYVASEASNAILASLLAEFRDRNLSSDDLRHPYKGLSPNELKSRCLLSGITEVDFELAMKDVERHGLVGTGPMAAWDNPPNSAVIIVGLYSKREYAYLKEAGYKEAVKLTKTISVTRSHVSPVIHGDQINNYGHVGAIGRQSTGTINFQQQWNQIAEQVNTQNLITELESLRVQLQKRASSRADYQQLGLLADAEEQAERKDGSKLMEALSKVGKGALDVAKEIGTELAAKVISKAIGLEP